MSNINKPPIPYISPKDWKHSNFPVLLGRAASLKSLTEQSGQFLYKWNLSAFEKSSTTKIYVI
jgi:hypothetical protein